MRTTSALGAAALLAVLPVAVHAQTATATESVTEKNTTIVIKEAPKPSPVTFTPYGFVLLNAFFNDSAGARNYPFPSVCTGINKVSSISIMTSVPSSTFLTMSQK